MIFPRLPYILTRRSKLIALARRLASLENRHFRDQREILASQDQVSDLAARAATLQSLVDCQAREIRRLTQDRDQALGEVQRLSDAARGTSRNLRFWIERQTAPHICEN